MIPPRNGLPIALLFLLLVPAPGTAQDVPAWLPRYDLEIRLDVDAHTVTTHQQVTWTNRHHRPADTLVFNAHAHYKVPKTEVGYFAKTLELLRMNPQEALDTQGEALDVGRVWLADQGKLVELPHRFEGDTNTDLTVTLP